MVKTPKTFTYAAGISYKPVIITVPARVAIIGAKFDRYAPILDVA